MSNNARQVALNIRRRISELFNVCGVIKAAADTWVLDDDDNLLPSDGVIKTALEAYESMKITPLRLFEEISEIKAGTGEPLPELPPVPVNVALNWESVLLKPTSYPPEDHDHLGEMNVVSWPDGISLLPDTFPPANHTHVVEWANVQNKQATYPPNEHSHNIAWGELTGKPTLMRLAEISWQGDGTTNRIITLPFAFTSGDLASNRAGVTGRIFPNGSLLRGDAVVLNGCINLSGVSLTLSSADMNVSGFFY